MKRFSKFSIIIATLAMLLVLAVGVQSSMAYFTSYAQSEGGETVELVHREELYEDVDDLFKAITIQNREEDSQPVFVRARVYIGAEFEQYLTYTPGEGWSDGGDGWWYYDEVLEPGDITRSSLSAGLYDIPIDEEGAFIFNDEEVDQSQINMVVVFESTLALYRYVGPGEYEPFAYWGELLDEGHTVVEGGSES